MNTNVVELSEGSRAKTSGESIPDYESGRLRGTDGTAASAEFDRFLKRQLDIVVSLLVLAVCSPLLLAVAIAIKLTDGGPVLYRQWRIGKQGRPFLLPKFRSMVPGADSLLHRVAADNHHGDSITFKMKRDPRITRVGRFIRRFSIDELPQLWCVLSGEMSLVGPRPALPREVANYDQAQRRRLDVAPGLTCIWQVSGRADVPFERQVAMDLEYIQTQSFALDLKLLFLTVPAVLSGRGAY
jgi:lipopolysaccharide/colanic/teichoic acid biosynthesis glycosyltransferase